MNLKSLAISALMLLIIFSMYSILGMGITTLILAIIFFVQAVLFTIKPEYYDKLLGFMNPGLYSAYSEKGSDFVRKKRRINIIGYYFLSAVMGMNAFMQIRLMHEVDNRQLFSFREFFPFALIILALIFVVNYISILAVKKSKTAGEDLGWNIIIGIVLAFVLIGFVSFYIIRTIL
ncbi:MAG: hypothetical protein ABRQ25_07240 [Clostridiaceae bacterium]